MDNICSHLLLLQMPIHALDVGDHKLPRFSSILSSRINCKKLDFSFQMSKVCSFSFFHCVSNSRSFCILSKTSSFVTCSSHLDQQFFRYKKIILFVKTLYIDKYTYYIHGLYTTFSTNVCISYMLYK